MKTSAYTVAQFRAELADGEFAFPGGYTRVFFIVDSEPVCYKCALAEKARMVRELRVQNYTRHRPDAEWTPLGCEPHWEGAPLQCVHCNKDIPSEYGDPENEFEGCSTPGETQAEPRHFYPLSAVCHRVQDYFKEYQENCRKIGAVANLADWAPVSGAIYGAFSVFAKELRAGDTMELPDGTTLTVTFKPERG